MSKKNGIISLLVIVVLLAGGIYTALFGLDADRTGSAYNIKQGLDLAGGVSITYEVVDDENPSQTDMDDTIYIVKSGDSLWSIAQKYNTTVNNLKSINNLTSDKLSIVENAIYRSWNSAGRRLCVVHAVRNFVFSAAGNGFDPCYLICFRNSICFARSAATAFCGSFIFCTVASMGQSPFRFRFNIRGTSSV